MGPGNRQGYTSDMQDMMWGEPKLSGLIYWPGPLQYTYVLNPTLYTLYVCVYKVDPSVRLTQHSFNCWLYFLHQSSPLYSGQVHDVSVRSMMSSLGSRLQSCQKMPRQQNLAINKLHISTKGNATMNKTRDLCIN